MLSDSVEQVLGPHGPFQAALPGFRVREGQRAMARAVSEAIQDNGVLVAEAGTGVGKTFAYLVPALLGHKRVLLSTGSKTLQDQLFHRDLPAVIGTLGVGPVTALLKGRSNYVCLHHLDRNLVEGRFESRQDATQLQRIRRFADLTRSGDRSEAPGIPEDAPAWAHATSTRDNCLGQNCERLDDCFLFKARRKALQADVVVVNHHLFCADLALRDEGVSELLPQAEVVIFDEAHQLPEVASQFFGQAMSSRQMIDFFRDLLVTGRADAPDGADWLALHAALEARLRDLRLAAGRVRRVDEQELKGAACEDFLVELAATIQSLEAPIAALRVNGARSRDLERLAVRAAGLRASLRGWLARVSPDRVGRAPVSPAPADEASAWPDTGIAGLDSETSTADVLAEPADSDDTIPWLDVFKSGFSLHLTPLRVSEPFRRQIEARPLAWIFTSATLAVSGRFDHFTSLMGLEAATVQAFESPFDFSTQALLYVPQALPEPRDPGFAKALALAIAPLIEANRGRAFVLCTSLRMVQSMQDELSTLLDTGAGDDGLTLLVQGTLPRAALLNRFRDLAQPVLIGSASFWEGVDVSGAQLSLVVIDKLPFAPPDDPIVQGRAKALRRQGGDPFTQMHLPQAAMALKQGAGRLIRSETDRGALVIGDIRLAEKAYGRRLLHSLPPFRRTRDAGEALDFVRSADENLLAPDLPPA